MANQVKIWLATQTDFLEVIFLDLPNFTEELYESFTEAGGESLMIRPLATLK